MLYDKMVSLFLVILNKGHHTKLTESITGFILALRIRKQLFDLFHNISVNGALAL
jgi:hypothetical protein